MPQKRKSTGTVAPAKSREAPTGERLQKVLAAAGVASRRRCEEYILAGRVEVDGQSVTELGTRVDAQEQEICVDGVRLRPPRHVYYAVNKPTGIVSTNSDPSGRPRVIDLVPGNGQRLFTVGRLDKSSEGLILVTNDGELAQRLTHPQYEVEKTYDVVVAGNLSQAKAKELERGVRLADGIAQVAGLKIKNRGPKSTRVQMVLREGRNREIRRVLASVGHKVVQLRRVRIASLTLGELQPGEFRQLNAAEVSMLKRSVARSAAGGKSSVAQRRKASVANTKHKPGYRTRTRRSTSSGGQMTTSASGVRKRSSSSGGNKSTAADGGRKSTATGVKRKATTTAAGRKPAPTTGARKTTSSQPAKRRGKSSGGQMTTSASGVRKRSSSGGGQKSTAADSDRKSTTTRVKSKATGATGGRKATSKVGARKTTSSQPAKRRGKSKAKRR